MQLVHEFTLKALLRLKDEVYLWKDDAADFTFALVGIDSRDGVVAILLRVMEGVGVVELTGSQVVGGYAVEDKFVTGDAGAAIVGQGNDRWIVFGMGNSDGVYRQQLEVIYEGI